MVSLPLEEVMGTMKGMYKQIEKCRICGNTELVEVLDLGVQALTGVFPETKDQPITNGPLRLVKCVGSEKVCGLLQLQHTYDLQEMYGKNYGYRSGLNASMVNHLHAKIRKILQRIELENGSLIIDIGSNDSTTLQAYPSDRFTLVGIDPTGVKFHDFYPPHIKLIPDFFSRDIVRENFGGKKASIITSFSMLYDLEQPLEFIRELCEVLDEEGLWIFEQSYMPTMLTKNSYDTACHEHLEYYALRQIKWMMDRVGLKIIDVEFNEINGGSFSVVAAKEASAHAASPAVGEILSYEESVGLHTLKPYQEFAERVQASRSALLAFLRDMRNANKTVCALGASTKGNVLLQYCGLTNADIEAIGEVNDEKFGCFTPGTLIPIISEDELLARKPDCLLVLPWHFRQFFENNPKFSEVKLVFPLPVLDVV